MSSSAEPNRFGPAEAKQHREKRVNECLAEVRRAVHDGEWAVALQEATELADRLVPLAAGEDGEES